jgi:4-diphosphocytidyl-2-C-methyl-D-erythritol kinase
MAAPSPLPGAPPAAAEPRSVSPGASLRVPVTTFAAAKVNLYLHVLGRRADGYHLLDSLVAFSDVGDRVTAEPAASLSLAIGGPEAADLLPLRDDNLVSRAARFFADHAGIANGAALHLEKHLPVAGGVGGGSSDAAAALLALRDLWRVPISDEALRELGAALGADVPACLYRRAVWAGGIGERLDPAGELPQAGILLANPRKPLPTASVFAAWPGPFGEAARFAPIPRDAAGLAGVLAQRRNDLTEAAMSLVPEIGAVLARLVGLPGALLARMSGSGATCFALFEGRAAAEAARAVLATAEPSWWCAAGGFLAGVGLCD